MFYLITCGLIFFSLTVYFRRPYYKGPVSDHFDGKVFRNIPPRDRTFRQLAQWLLNRKATPWPAWVPIEKQAKPQERVLGHEMVVTFVNHSTLLLQWEGHNFLTDPIWSDRAGPFTFLGPKRVHAPGIAFEDLPPIDFVLLSHSHYDHMDKSTLKALYERDSPKIITGIGNAKVLQRFGIKKCVELDWWQETNEFNPFTIAYTPAQHFSARTLWDMNKALWGGFVVKAPSGVLFFAGDTGEGDHFKQIAEKYGSARLALLPIGACEPRWFMRVAHMSPEDVIIASNQLQAKQSLAIHFGTFDLSDEGIDDPPQRLKKALQGDNSKFWIPSPGETFFVP